MKKSVFWESTTYSPVKQNRRFGGRYLFHLQNRIVSQAIQHEAGRRAFHLTVLRYTQEGRTPHDHLFDL
jgi:hypothetical protein